MSAGQQVMAPLPTVPWGTRAPVSQHLSSNEVDLSSHYTLALSCRKLHEDLHTQMSPSRVAPTHFYYHARWTFCQWLTVNRCADDRERHASKAATFLKSATQETYGAAGEARSLADTVGRRKYYSERGGGH